MDVCVVVLAGGEGKRMGFPKIFARLSGIPLYLFALDAPYRTILVTRRNLRPQFLPPRVEVLYDEGRGPAAALKRALEIIEEERVVIRPIDMPFLSRKRISKHIGEGIVTFSSGNRIHRIASIRPREELEVRGDSMRSLFRGKNYRVVELDACEGLNINTPEDLLLGLECLKQGYGSISALTKREAQLRGT